MKYLTLGLTLLSLGVGPSIHVPAMCQGAQLAVVHAAILKQERSTPKDEWCQRPPIRDKKAHACHCHKAACDDPDPDHLPAHVDPMCLNFCAIDNCACVEMDCS